MIILRKTQLLEAIEFVKVEEFLLIATGPPAAVAGGKGCSADQIALHCQKSFGFLRCVVFLL